MATQVQFRRGTTTQNNAFTGAAGELTYDTDVKTLRLHDGTSPGGGAVVINNISSQTLLNKTLSTGSVWQGNAVGLAYGGTGSSLTAVAGALAYSGASGLALTAAGTAGQILVSGGVSAPTWVSTSSISSGSSTLATTATNIAGGSAGQLVIQADTNLSTFITAGATGTFLKSAGAGYAPTWATADVTIGTTVISLGSSSTSLAGLDILTATGTSNWKIPAGTTAQRPGTPAVGMIRYNSSITSFEGYSSGAWASLGGVSSVDKFTYIQAETAANASNGDLDFFAENSAGTGAIQVGQWNRTNLKDYTGTLVGTQTTQNVFNATATTINAFGAASTIALGKDGATVTTLQGKLTAVGTFHTSHLTTFGSLFIDGTSTNNIIQTSSNTRTNGIGIWSTGGTPRLYSSGDIELRVGVTLRDQDTPQGGLTAVTITTGTGAVSLANNLTVTGDVAVNGGDVTTTSTTGTLFNTGATTLNIGGAATTVSIGAATGTLTINNANTVITGNLTVNGTTTTINSTVTSVDDIEFELGSVASPTDITAAGGGIRLKGTTDKTINWSSIGWTSSEDFNLVTGKSFEINGTVVLDASSVLGSAVTATLAGAATTLTIGATTGTATIRNTTVAVTNNATVGGTLGVTGLITSTGGISGGASSHTSGSFSTTLGVTGASTFTGATTHNGGLGATSGTFSTTLGVTGASTFTGATNHNGGLAATSGTFSTTLGVTSTSTFTGKATFNGGIDVVDAIAFDYNFTGTTSATTPTAMTSFATATYRSGRVLMQVVNGTAYRILELLFVHDGTTVTLSENYVTGTEIQTAATNTTFSASITTGTLTIFATASSGTSVIKGTATLFKV